MSTNPHLFVRVALPAGHFTVPRATAEAGEWTILEDHDALDKNGRPLPPKLRTSRDDGQAQDPPAKSKDRATWDAYADHLGLTQDYLATLTKAEVIEITTDPDLLEAALAEISDTLRSSDAAATPTPTTAETTVSPEHEENT